MCQGWHLTGLIPGQDKFWRGSSAAAAKLNCYTPRWAGLTKTHWFLGTQLLHLFAAWTASLQTQITPTVFPVPRITSSLLVNTCPAEGPKWSSGATSGSASWHGTDRPSWGHSPEDPAAMKAPLLQFAQVYKPKSLRCLLIGGKGGSHTGSWTASRLPCIALPWVPAPLPAPLPPVTRASFGSSSILTSISGHVPMPSSAPPSLTLPTHPLDLPFLPGCPLTTQIKYPPHPPGYSPSLLNYTLLKYLILFFCSTYCHGN